MCRGRRVGMRRRRRPRRQAEGADGERGSGNSLEHGRQEFAGSGRRCRVTLPPLSRIYARFPACCLTANQVWISEYACRGSFRTDSQACRHCQRRRVYTRATEGGPQPGVWCAGELYISGPVGFVFDLNLAEAGQFFEVRCPSRSYATGPRARLKMLHTHPDVPASSRERCSSRMHCNRDEA